MFDVNYFYRPQFFFKNKDVLNLKKQKDVTFVDAFERQIKELFLVKNTCWAGEEKDKIYTSNEFKGFLIKNKMKFQYVYYPWIQTLVKTVKDGDYFLLRTSRNRNLVSKKEQEKLYRFKVAVLGMSVGGNIALVLAQSGISREMILADFDELETTNLNRILAGVHQVGLNKAIIVARKIYEMDPFSKLNVLEKGIDEKVLERLLKEKKIDCIVEEIDHIQMKISVRKLAIKYKVPVVMVTDNGEWAVLHIERFDLGYKKIFGKSSIYWEKKMSKKLTKKDFADIVINDVVGGVDKIDPRMLSSVKDVVERKLVSWPQLGSSALLGAVAVTIAIKNIVSGKNKRLFVREYLKILK